MKHRIGLSATCVLITAMISQTGLPGPSAEAQVREGPIFRFQTDGFWLNLHHFLYVLGRVEAQMPDIERRAVAQAPQDQAEGLQGLPPDQQQQWREAVSAYAGEPSRLDPIFDEALYSATRRLVDAGDSLDGVEIKPSWAEALRRAAPVYRRIWWPDHQSANRAWVEGIEPLLEKHGRRILDFITRTSGLPWPVDGFPVQVSGYCNWAGAYSTEGSLLVLSSLDEELRGTTHALELVFHEAMHQWDEAEFAALVAAAKAQEVRFPQGLSHAMLFFTVGEAMRTVIPDHVPYAHQYGVWQRGSGRFLPMLEESWRPYLHGMARRDQALADLMGHFKQPNQQ